ncbi:hypothetical protein [uncultured Martelella sp.]|uniref:hypothetical protein n=1 Tax=uncultured Martelella sp. TaxID=392331 RepID=UPI0029C863CA|nr:hypothetical protein [uncultured Martelella sp.]
MAKGMTPGDNRVIGSPQMLGVVFIPAPFKPEEQVLFSTLQVAYRRVPETTRAGESDEYL